MAFKFAESDSAGIINSGTITVLSPAPTYVDYPPKFLNTVQSSKDGNPVIQSPLRDNRVRSWIWTNYKFDTPGYDSLYHSLLNLQYKLRLTASPAKPVWIFLYEDVTDEFTNLTESGGVWTESVDWIRTKVIAVDRTVRRSGGKATYDETALRFVIDDSSYNAF